MKKICVLAFVILIAVQYCSSAHQPRLLDSEVMIKVPEPEISKAYYAELKGTPAIFVINSEEPFRLYVNVLVPDIKDIKKDISAKILCDGRVIAKLDAASSEWQSFYEEFGGDNYFKGPEYVKDVKPGDYEIVVYSPSNTGKYVVAIGDVESFPPQEMLSALIAMPSLKLYFEKSPLLAFNNRIGEFLLPPILAILLVFAAAVIIAKKVGKR